MFLCAELWILAWAASRHWRNNCRPFGPNFGDSCDGGAFILRVISLGIASIWITVAQHHHGLPRTVLSAAGSPGWVDHTGKQLNLYRMNAASWKGLLQTRIGAVGARAFFFIFSVFFLIRVRKVEFSVVIRVNIEKVDWMILFCLVSEADFLIRKCLHVKSVISPHKRCANPSEMSRLSPVIFSCKHQRARAEKCACLTVVHACVIVLKELRGRVCDHAPVCRCPECGAQVGVCAEARCFAHCCSNVSSWPAAPRARQLKLRPLHTDAVRTCVCQVWHVIFFISMFPFCHILRCKLSFLCSGEEEKKLRHFCKAGDRQEEFVRFMTTMMTALHLRLHFPLCCSCDFILRCSDSSHAGWKCRKPSGFGQDVAPPQAVAACSPRFLFPTHSVSWNHC